MSDSTEARTILVDALLAGHTLLTRRDQDWIAQDIMPGGVLGERRPVSGDPSAPAWRGGPAR
jgi:hypothetical protein